MKKSFLFHRPRRHEAAVCYATLAFMIMTPLHLNNKKSVIYFFPSFQRVSLSQTREHNSTLFVKYRFCCLYFCMKQKLPITNPSKRSALSHTDAFIHSHIQCTYSCPPRNCTTNNQLTNYSWQFLYSRKYATLLYFIVHCEKTHT